MTVQEERSPGRLGPYRLRERLGEGGMGVVYLATDPSECLVAVKALRRGVPGDMMARRRLAREFETMRRVHSPFVAEVIDANVENDPPYIVTRYVPGRTVEEVVAQDGPITGPGLLALARGLASALTAVHAAGVVHRDLKPANVMIVNGEPVVIDFGIAQAPDSTRLTMTGMFMGTPGYLAPEVIEGSPSGPAADVHSWAATVAFAATGRPPFGSGSFEAIFYRIVNGQPDLATMPSPLMPLVLHALARDPARRPTAADLADRVGGLNPATLFPRSAAAIPSPNGSAGATMGDLPGGRLLAGGPGGGPAGWGAGAGMPGAMAGGVGVAMGGAGQGSDYQAGWPNGTRELAARPPDSFADLLPPVNYGQPPASGAPQPWDQQPGGPPFAQPTARPADRSADRPHSARRPLVLATIATAIAASVLLPVAGTVASLLGLVALRSADLTSSRLERRRSRQGRRAADAAAILAYLPFAVFRSLLRLVLVLPLALLFAAAAAAVTFVALPGHPLPRAGAYAAGALVACYGLGPGSSRCRRPLGKFFGAITDSPASAVVVFVGMAALAVGVLSAAFSLPPFFWPANHLNPQLHIALIPHGLLHPGRLNLLKLVKSWGIWPFG
jgi:Protein kinase domain